MSENMIKGVSLVENRLIGMIWLVATKRIHQYFRCNPPLSSFYTYTTYSFTAYFAVQALPWKMY